MSDNEKSKPQAQDKAYREIEKAALPQLSTDDKYHKALQGKPIHKFIASSTAPQSVQIDAITGGGVIDSDGVIMRLDPEAIPELSGQTSKILIMYLTKAAEQLPQKDQLTAEAIRKNRVISLSLAEYMDACKVKDKHSARDQLNSAVKALYGISFEFDEKEYDTPEGKSKKVKVVKHHRMRFTDHTITQEEGNPVKRGVAEIRLSFDMAEYLATRYISPYPVALLTINTHNNPYSIPLGWKLCDLDNVNITNNNPERVGRTTVQTLLRSAKGIPRYEAIAHKGQIYRLIIERFDRDMRALVDAGVLSSYSYHDESGKTISSEELGGLSYHEFSVLNVWYQLKDYPDQTQRLEAKQKKLDAAISRARNNARKKKQQEAQTAESESE